MHGYGLDWHGLTFLQSKACFQNLSDSLWAHLSYTGHSSNFWPARLRWEVILTKTFGIPNHNCKKITKCNWRPNQEYVKCLDCPPFRCGFHSHLILTSSLFFSLPPHPPPLFFFFFFFGGGHSYEIWHKHIFILCQSCLLFLHYEYDKYSFVWISSLFFVIHLLCIRNTNIRTDKQLFFFFKSSLHSPFSFLSSFSVV